MALSHWQRLHKEVRDHIIKTSKLKHIKAAICGFLAGDGSVQIRKEKNFFHYQVDFFPDDQHMLDTYLDMIEKIYNKKPTIRIEHKHFTARFSSKPIVQDLVTNAQFGQSNWNVPWNLLQTTIAKKFWLRAFFSAEAYVGPKAIKIQTINKRGMLEISQLLNELGITNNLYEYSPKNKNYNDVTIIFITKKVARKAFYEEIGFWHSKKTATLKKSLNL